MTSALGDAGFAIEPGSKYLDFGCSSGRTVRTLSAAYLDAGWFGADPDDATISWAKKVFPFIEFINSPELPPLPVSEKYFDGVYAISVWSHFRQDAALAWFEEMHRVIRVGGFLLFTTPSFRKFFNIYEGTGKISELKLRELLKDGFVFRNVKSARNLDSKTWGEAHISIGWVASKLLGKWSIRQFIPAGHQNQQDIYVLERR